jgi:putative phosphoesterase
MKIGVIADSHDHLPPLRRAVHHLARLQVDAIIHVGDFIAPFAAKLIAPPYVPESIPVHCCYGNNDGERAGLKMILPQVVDGPVKLNMDGKKIVFHHFIDWLTPDDIAEADIVITGHTHEIVNERRNGKLILNPGECCGWLTDRCTIAILDPEAMSAEIVEITT